MQNKTELRIQQDCYVWFTNTYPQYRGLFFRIVNENTNKIRGAINKATGVIPGVADSCLIIPKGPACFIEFKTSIGKQSKIQKDWGQKIRESSHFYFIIRSLTEFQTLCQKTLGLQ